MKQETFSTQEFDKLEEPNHRYFQIDVLKAVMIFLVIFDHTYPWALKDLMGVALWERISIPVFLVIMGFNMGLSFRHTGETSLKKLYSWNYFKKKFWRYIFPFIVLYILSTVLGLAIGGFNALNQYQMRWSFAHLFIGILPFYGPGNWFLPVVFWSILILPLLYKGFSGKLIWRIITLFLCYIIELLVHLSVLLILIPNVSSAAEFYFYYDFIVTTPIFMLSAIGLGLWFSKNPNIFAKQNIFMWILFPLSLVYLIAYQFFNFDFNFVFGDYHLFIFPYSAFLVLFALKVISKRVNDKNLFVRRIKIISNSTYHILLAQILYFAVVINLWTDHYGASLFGIDMTYNPIVVFLYVLVNWIICVPLGVLWWYGENKVRQYRRSRKKL
ncbi:MAG: acyltransferase family protein [Candidatus Odinarchaeota archaeon]